MSVTVIVSSSVGLTVSLSFSLSVNVWGASVLCKCSIKGVFVLMCMSANMWQIGVSED